MFPARKRAKYLRVFPARTVFCPTQGGETFSALRNLRRVHPDFFVLATRTNVAGFTGGRLITRQSSSRGERTCVLFSLDAFETLFEAKSANDLAQGNLWALGSRRELAKSDWHCVQYLR